MRMNEGEKIHSQISLTHLGSTTIHENDVHLQSLKRIRIQTNDDIKLRVSPFPVGDDVVNGDSRHEFASLPSRIESFYQNDAAEQYKAEP
jgi:hypothetical protein